jgi:hypothetical protein
MRVGTAFIVCILSLSANAFGMLIHEYFPKGQNYALGKQIITEDRGQVTKKFVLVQGDVKGLMYKTRIENLHHSGAWYLGLLDASVSGYNIYNIHRSDESEVIVPGLPGDEPMLFICVSYSLLKRPILSLNTWHDKQKKINFKATIAGLLVAEHESGEYYLGIHKRKIALKSTADQTCLGWDTGPLPPNYQLPVQEIEDLDYLATR